MNSTELYFYIKHLNSLKFVSAYLLYLIHVNMPVYTVDVDQKSATSLSKCNCQAIPIYVLRTD